MWWGVGRRERRGDRYTLRPRPTNVECREERKRTRTRCCKLSTKRLGHGVQVVVFCGPQLIPMLGSALQPSRNGLVRADFCLHLCLLYSPLRIVERYALRSNIFQSDTRKVAVPLHQLRQNLPLKAKRKVRLPLRTSSSRSRHCNKSIRFQSPPHHVHNSTQQILLVSIPI